jgi:spore germination protein YaaH
MRIFLSYFMLAASLAFMREQVSAQQQPDHLFYYIDTEQCFDDFRVHADKITILSPAWFSADEDGVVWGDVDPRVLAVAKEHAVQVIPLIANRGFNQSMLSRLLHNESARRRAIASMAELCVQHSFAGIQFDFENLHIADRDAFSQFYRETAQALHAKGFTLSVAVVHRPEEYAGPTEYHKWLFKNWRAGYDLAELATAGDFISVMTYSQHTRRTTPGPNAGIPWMTQVVEYFLKYVPAQKLSLGIPLKSQRWYTALDTAGFSSNAHSWNESMDYGSAVAYLERHNAKVEWNEKQQVPFAVVENDGLFEHLYLEDARSFRTKYDLIRKYSLRGFSAWVIGGEDPAVWDNLPRVNR